MGHAGSLVWCFKVWLQVLWLYDFTGRCCCFGLRLEEFGLVVGLGFLVVPQRFEVLVLAGAGGLWVWAFRISGGFWGWRFRDLPGFGFRG